MQHIGENEPFKLATVGMYECLNYTFYEVYNHPMLHLLCQIAFMCISCARQGANNRKNKRLLSAKLTEKSMTTWRGTGQVWLIAFSLSIFGSELKVLHFSDNFSQ
jgi:hypothetical protein